MADKIIFIDTNILVYAYDFTAGEKHIKAKEIIDYFWSLSFFPFISIQVLNEFFINLIRKKVGFKDSKNLIEAYLSWNIIKNDEVVLLKSLDIMEKYKISYWDSSIIAAANIAQVSELWTEDLNHGQMYGGVKAINPLIQ